MATLRISVDRKTLKVIKEEIIPSDFKPDMEQFYKDVAQHLIETKGIEFWRSEESLTAPVNC